MAEAVMAEAAGILAEAGILAAVAPGLREFLDIIQAAWVQAFQDIILEAVSHLLCLAADMAAAAMELTEEDMASGVTAGLIYRLAVAITAIISIRHGPRPIRAAIWAVDMGSRFTPGMTHRYLFRKAAAFP
jgi:hypothetical protein